MPVTVERLEAEVDADPAKAIAALSTFDAALTAVARDRTAHVDVDVDHDSTRIAATALDHFRNVALDAGRGLEGGLGKGADIASNAIESLAENTVEAGKAMAGAGGGADGLTSSLSGAGGAAKGAGGNIAMMGGAVLLMIPAIGALLGIIPQAIGLINALGGGFVALAGAVAPALGLLATAPGILLALGGGIGSVMLGIGGISDALKTAANVQKSANETSKDATQIAREQASAERGLEQAVRGVIRAQEGLARSQEAVGEAREQAARNIKNLGRDVTSSVWAEEDAVERLRRAQENLDRAQKKVGKSGAILSRETDDFTGKVYEVARISMDATDSQVDLAGAQRDVARAQQELQRAQERTKDSREALNDAQAKGIEGSDLVKAAIRSVTDAQYGLLSAQDNVAASQDRIARAMESAARGQNGSTAAINAHQAAMAALTQEGRDFVTFMTDELQPAWKKVKDAAQRALLPPIQAGLKAAIGALPVLEQAVGTFASVVGKRTNEVLMLMAGPWRSDIQDILISSGTVLDNLMGGAVALGGALKDIVWSARELTEWFSGAVKSALEDFAAKMAEMRANGDLAAFFDKAREVGSKLWAILVDVWGAVSGIITAATPLGTWILDGLVKVTDEWNAWVNSDPGQSALSQWFNGLRPVLSEIWNLVKVVASEFLHVGENGEPVMSNLASLIRQIANAVPGIVQFLKDMTTFLSPVIFMVSLFAQAWERARAAIDWLIRHIPFLNSAAGGNGAIGLIGSLVSNPMGALAGHRATGGHVRKGEPYLVGERRPEVFVPDQAGRVVAQPNTAQSMGSTNGISDAQLERILTKVMANAKAPISIEQTFMEKPNPKLLSSELAWSLR